MDRSRRAARVPDRRFRAGAQSRRVIARAARNAALLLECPWRANPLSARDDPSDSRAHRGTPFGRAYGLREDLRRARLRAAHVAVDAAEGTAPRNSALCETPSSVAV